MFSLVDLKIFKVLILFGKKYFKDPIEAPDQVAGPILDQTELKEIFGNLPPIYEVHCKIKDRLERLANRINLNFNDDAGCVGDIYLDNADALLKTYPPFVNFYEKTKEMIVNCDKTKPRFHAFLKITQSKPECGRQTLIDLFIRPVQRLPSTLLLLDGRYLLLYSNKKSKLLII